MALQFNYNKDLETFLESQGITKTNQVPSQLERDEFCVYETAQGKFISVFNNTGQLAEKAGFELGRLFQKWLK